LVVSELTGYSFVNPEVRKPYLVPVNIILISIATLMVLLRIYARFIRTCTATIDDWLVIIALFPAIGLTVTVSLAATRYGWSQHIWDYEYEGVDPSKLIQERVISWISQMLYVWSSTLAKLSLLFFYRRIFSTTYIRVFVLGCIYFVLVYFVACFLTLLLECRPLSLYWHILVLPQGTGGVCADEGNLLLASGVVNVIIDWIILLLPIRTALKLHIQWPQKLQVLAVFMAGALVCVSSIIRVTATFTTVRETYDVTWSGYLVWMWIGIEVDVGIICASVPACKSLFKSWRQKLGTIRNLSDRQPSGPDRTIQKTTETIIEGSYVEIIAMKNGDKDFPENWTGGLRSMTTTTAWAGKDEEYDLEYLGDQNPRPVTPKSVLNSASRTR
jgi:hypothetical protein